MEAVTERLYVGPDSIRRQVRRSVDEAAVPQAECYRAVPGWHGTHDTQPPQLEGLVRWWGGASKSSAGSTESHSSLGFRFSPASEAGYASKDWGLIRDGRSSSKTF